MSSGKAGGKVTGLRFSPWNLLLLVPLAILITPLYHSEDPRLFGVPFFYWFQLVFVLVGVLSVLGMYLLTRRVGTNAGASKVSVDDLDEGERR